MHGLGLFSHLVQIVLRLSGLQCDLHANKLRRGLDYEIRKSAIEKQCSELKASAADARICRDLAKTKANRLRKHAISSLLSAAERKTQCTTQCWKRITTSSTRFCNGEVNDSNH
jgi:hypothetical protein